MRSKIKATHIAKKQAKAKASHKGPWEEAAALESQVISLIRGLPREHQYLSYLAADVRQAGKVCNIESLKILQWFIRDVSAREAGDRDTFNIYAVEEIDSTLYFMGVPERHQCFTAERMNAAQAFREKISGYPSPRAEKRMEAEVLMNPDSAPILEQLVLERGLRSWDAIEPLFKEAIQNSLPLTEGTL